MFISNNRPSFHLWRKKNLVKHQKVSEYCETDCSSESSDLVKCQNKPSPLGFFT